MKFIGNNINDVLIAHKRWLNGDKGVDRADFMNADLTKVCLKEADLRGADFRGACLIEAELTRANLMGADLRGACLIGADLRGADFRGACLKEANLSGTDLREANLTEAKNIPFIPMACPDSGAFVGWKQCRTHGEINASVIVKLLIPDDAKRSSSTGRKCRCDKAVVLEIQNMDGTTADVDVAYAYSKYDNGQRFAYKVGETVVPEKPFDDNRWVECTSGIHFFINRQEAVDY